LKFVGFCEDRLEGARRGTTTNTELEPPCLCRPLEMSKSFHKNPVRIHCPCADSPADAPLPQDDDAATPAPEEQARRIFNPTLPRAQYSLHPLAYLYFCQECQAIRCPRCVQEEIVSAFCPMCLFEVPLTSIKADGNRFCTMEA
jgi:hypothetical protein